MNENKYLLQNKSILPFDGEAYYFPHYLDKNCLEPLLQCFSFESHAINMFGKTLLMPRLIGYQGEKGYRYSTINHSPCAYHPLIKAQLDTLKKDFDVNFNSVLANYYRSGADSMSWHRDNESWIDHSYIASLSFGQERDFVFRHRESKEKVNITLTDGSLLLMKDCQDTWEHAIPKRKKQLDPRLNLTFRKVL